MYMDTSCNIYINFLTCFYKKYLNLVSGLNLTLEVPSGVQHLLILKVNVTTTLVADV